MIDGPVDGYEILGRIGEGSHGEVFLARDEQLDRKVALKFLRESREDDEVVRKRFLREGRMAAALSHPGVAAIHGASRHDGRVFLVYEFVEGKTLREELDRGAFPAAEVALIGHRLAEALTHVHENGIVHRDLKPSNVMLTPRGRLKILDFGIALSPDYSRLTGSGTIPATVAYVAPEVLRGSSPQASSDLWALGVLLYECLTRRLPFLGETPFKTMVEILHGDPPPPSDLAPDVPEELEAVLLRMLRKPLERRYSTARAVSDAFRELQETFDGE